MSIPANTAPVLGDVESSGNKLYPDEEVLPPGRRQNAAFTASAPANGATPPRGPTLCRSQTMPSGNYASGQRPLHHQATYQDVHESGASPGIDVKRRKYDHLHQKFRTRVKIECIDFNDTQVAFSPQMGNADVKKFLARPRPAWSKVRWLNIEGVSWDVIEEVARHYDLHPLAVEDIVHIPQRIKCDLYEGFIYLSLILLNVEKEGQQAAAAAEAEAASRMPPLAREGDAAPLSAFNNDREDMLTALLNPAPQRGASGGGEPDQRWGSISGQRRPDVQELRTPLFKQMQLEQQTKRQPISVIKREINVLTEQVSLFLLRDGTLISIFQREGDSVTEPILAQIREPRTLLRDSQDPSFLLNLLIDAVVDHAFPVVDTYGALLQRYEDRMLLGRPDASVTRELHIMQGDMRLLRHTLLPASALVHMLRSRDIDLGSAVSVGTPGPGGEGSHSPHSTGHGHPHEQRPKLISDLTRTYLADVQDHLSQLLEVMETLGTHAKDCIDLCFNLTSHSANQAMQTLAVVSTVFLPITFLAGVYGTNFDVLPELHWKFGYPAFWLVCIAITMVFIFVLARLNMLKGQ